ncbi:DUF6484 domain-containing protein [Hahella ganghwensis]|uniref:DUF6484 domain-containing protein n=1 Tax=Hahella ganghwensis TaxID=286420 RepID=UPI00037C712A|nr:DUF6484 domain-containing protein [Hahella ganghwensis]
MTTELRNETKHATSETDQGSGLLVGWIVDIDTDGNPRVAWDEASSQNPQAALATVPVSNEDAGRDIAISFARNAGGQPIIVGFLYSRLDQSVAHTQALGATIDISSQEQPKVSYNGKDLEIQAEGSITLRCGKSRLTLNKDGKILLQGEQILSRARGSQRIKGGSIQLN